MYRQYRSFCKTEKAAGRHTDTHTYTQTNTQGVNHPSMLPWGYKANNSFGSLQQKAGGRDMAIFKFVLTFEGGL